MGVVVALASVSGAGAARAEEAAAKATAASDQTAIGVTAGLLSGVGFAWRKYYTDGTVNHLGGIAFGDKTSAFANVGYERHTLMASYGESALYSYWGASVYYSDFESMNCDDDATKDTVRCERGRERMARVSAGPGLSFVYGVSKGLSAALELPLALSYSYTITTKEGLLSVFPVPAVVLQYRL
jgi:hypothetical protein